MLKIADVVFSLVLLMLAVIQLNDPDPLVLVRPLFSLCAYSVTDDSSRSKRSDLLDGSGILPGRSNADCGGAAEYLQHMDQESLMQAMSPSTSYIEEAREFMGSLIALSVISLHFRLHRRERIRRNA